MYKHYSVMPVPFLYMTKKKKLFEIYLMLCIVFIVAEIIF